MHKTDSRQSESSVWPVFLLVASGVFLSTMDSSMVNVALPSIMRDFGVPLREVQWVVLVYLLTITVTLLLWGIAADRLGKQVIYLVGIGLFTGGSIACSQAPHLSWLIAARFFEGCGAAMMMSAGPGIIRDVFPRHQLGKGLGLIGIATSLGLMTGPAISGLVITGYSWRDIFLVTVPLSILVLVAGCYILNRPGLLKPPGGKRVFDWKGSLLWALCVISFILFAHFLPLLNPLMKFLAALGLAALAGLFVWAEKSRTSAILPLHLFSRRYYHIGLLTAAASFGTLFVVLILMPFYLDYIKNLPANLIGMMMMAVPLTLFIASPTAGILYDRYGSRHLTTIGLGVCSIALFLLAAIDDASHLADISWRLALLGMGQAIFLAPNTASLLTRIDDTDVGVTSGLLATSRNLGMLTGAAFASMVFAAWFSHFSGGAELGGYVPAQGHYFVSALRATFLCTAGVSALTALLSWQRRR